jgi:hypothetical protein
MYWGENSGLNIPSQRIEIDGNHHKPKDGVVKNSHPAYLIHLYINKVEITPLMSFKH